MSGFSGPYDRVVLGSSTAIISATALTVNTALSVTGAGTFNSGNDVNSSVTIGSGFATPTAERVATLQINVPSNGTFLGTAELRYQRAGSNIWTSGIDKGTTGTKSAASDFYWFNGSSYVMSVSTAGALTTAAGITVQGGTTPLSLTQTAATSGSPSAISLTAGAHTTLAIAEVNDINFNLARTVNFTSGGGTIATQRAVLIQAPTYSATTNAVTLTQAATFAITGAPTASTNVTITNPYAFWVQAGNTRLDGNVGIQTAPSAATGVAIGMTLTSQTNATGLSVAPTISGGTNPIGIGNTPTMTLNTTGNVAAMVNHGIWTVNASQTITNLWELYVNPSAVTINAGGAITNRLGIEITAIGDTCTTAYGLKIGNIQGGSSASYAIKTGLGTVSLGDAAIITSNSATAFTVGPNGTTNPAFQVNGNVASAATGVLITGNAAGSGAAIGVLSSAAAEDLFINAKSTGVIHLGAITQYDGTNTTGVGSASLGANCPAVTLTAPYKWFQMKSSDGSTVYIPAWK